MMNSIRDRLARVYNLDYMETLELHFALQEEIKKQIQLKNEEETISLCEKSIAISSLVMAAMKRKHIAQADEYARATGNLSPLKFTYPNHYAHSIISKIYEKKGQLDKLAEMNDKLSSDGWNSGRQEELYFL
ncbi:hypothetical protein ACUII0_002457 [Providencia rettgeri]